MIPKFKASFEVANYDGEKRLKKRKGYTKLSNTITFGGLSVDALALYIQLTKLGEKTIVSEVYLREFIKVKDGKRISIGRLRAAKRELIKFKLLEINKVRKGSLFFYEWILKNELGEVKRHFNKTLTSPKNSDENLLKALKNNALSIDTNSNTDKEKNQNVPYIETHTHARNKENLENINNKFTSKENLENLKDKQEKKECVAHANAIFADGLESGLKNLNEKEIKEMAKKQFKIPSIADLMGQIKAFNEKHGTSFDEKLAEDFIGYWDAREWKRGDKRMASIAGSLYTWLKNSKENEANRRQGYKGYKKRQITSDEMSDEEWDREIEEYRKKNQRSSEKDEESFSMSQGYYIWKAMQEGKTHQEALASYESMQERGFVIDCEIIDNPKNLTYKE